MEKNELVDDLVGLTDRERIDRASVEIGELDARLQIIAIETARVHVRLDETHGLLCQLLAVLPKMLRQQAHRSAAASARVADRLDRELIAKVERFFGPMMEGRNPPLDGEQIATKKFVDDSLQRFARVVRSEIAQAASAQRRRRKVAKK